MKDHHHLRRRRRRRHSTAASSPSTPPSPITSMPSAPPSSHSHSSASSSCPATAASGSLSLSLLLSPYSSSSSTPLPLTLLVALLLDVVVIGLMKHLVKRPRPAYNAAMGRIIPVDHWSFPSGHASRVCAIASVLCLNHSGDDAVLVGVWVWAGVTAGSRVVLGRHYVMDVVVGLWIGVVVGFVADWIGRVYVLDLWKQRY